MQTKINLSTQGFIQHMEQKHASIERDLLLLEVARKLRLTDDLRFSYFFQHCKQYKGKPAYKQIVSYSFDEYRERLQGIVDDLAKDECRTKEIETLGSILALVNTLFTDYLFELDQALRDAFPEYYSNNQSEQI